MKIPHTTHPHRTDASHVSAAWRAIVSYDASQAIRSLEGSARIDSDRILLPGGQYARGKGRFILVYRLAMDASPWRGDDVAG